MTRRFAPASSPPVPSAGWLAAAAAVAVILLASGPAAAEEQSGCLKCHASKKVLAQVSTPRRAALVLDPKALKKSVHADVDCTDCHSQLADAEADQPHKKKLGPPTCGECHDEAAKVYKGSVHGQALAKGDRDVARCGDCHGAHDIVKVKNPRSRVFKLRLPFTCARCHKNVELAKQHGIHEALAAKQYVESIHGKALLRDGLIVAPSCTDCHGAHDIRKSEDKTSRIHHDNVPATCGKCHVGIIETYKQSVHGKLVGNTRGKGKRQGPVCVDCHTAHQIVQPEKGVFKLETDARCGKCHADRLERYRETYHGKAIALGQQNVAACHDCHGSHDIRPHTDPKSKLSKENKLATCKSCHPKAKAGFTGYLTHGDHTDKQNYPKLYWAYVLMTALLLGVFAFFGLHTLLWFVRSLALYLRDPEAFRKRKQREREVERDGDGKVYVRFSPVDRFCHFLVIISFLLLVITGMPLKFYYTGWARWMFGWLGGPEVAAALHRLGAVITFIYFAIHLVRLLGSLWRNRPLYRDEAGRFRVRKLLRFMFGPDSPMPNWQDFKDFWAHQKWFFGRGDKPQFDRWTYWEKFDYLAVFWGVAVIGLSGMVMWFPEAFTSVLPGWSINIAHVVHSDEALLAAGFIFTFHFFNVHFRVEKFPMDSVIFSGRITEHELKHERRRLYDRLEREGRLEAEQVRDEWPLWKRIFNPIGMLAFTIGVLLIVAIYWAMASRLVGH